MLLSLCSSIGGYVSAIFITFYLIVTVGDGMSLAPSGMQLPTLPRDT